MPSFPLTDIARDLWVESFSIGPDGLGLPAALPWSVTKRTLRGGRRDGVDLIQLNNGALSVAIVPTRGMNLWRGQYQGDRLGWNSPVADGPVHPSHVNLSALGGFGWLDGFDELLARCGLEHTGPPIHDGPFAHSLHGKISNRPAHEVWVHIADEPPYEISVEGHVDESRLFGPRLRMTSRVSTIPGSNRLVVRDVFTNLGDWPAAMQVLYHWNFGPPYLEEGAKLVAPARVVAPQTPRAAEGIHRYDSYGPPEPGFAEQVYLFDLLGNGDDGQTLAMLRTRSADKGVVLRFQKSQLPCFTVWKNLLGPREGYVTGLEPATNYPNPRPFEQSQGRMLTLEPGEQHVAETVLEVLDTPEAVAAVEAEARSIQARAALTVHETPTPPYTPAP
ncbi:aldose 1-epimerase family protein [soil metagenome]